MIKSTDAARSPPAHTHIYRVTHTPLAALYTARTHRQPHTRPGCPHTGYGTRISIYDRGCPAPSSRVAPSCHICVGHTRSVRLTRATRPANNGGRSPPPRSSSSPCVRTRSLSLSLSLFLCRTRPAILASRGGGWLACDDTIRRVVEEVGVVGWKNVAAAATAVTAAAAGGGDGGKGGGGYMRPLSLRLVSRSIEMTALKTNLTLDVSTAVVTWT